MNVNQKYLLIEFIILNSLNLIAIFDICNLNSVSKQSHQLAS